MIKRILALSLIIIFALGYTHGYALGISASSAVVINTLTGEVAYEHNAHQIRPMASTTKIMTAICAIENGDLNDMVKVHPKAVGVEGSSMYLAHGEVISLKDLLYGLMLSSGNDAAVAIAMHISGSVDAFAELMNKTAVKIGVKNTSFKNPNGLDDENHYTTAHDLALITRYGMNIPEFAEIVGTDTIKVPWHERTYPRVLKNHNKLLNMYEGANGVKTGFTKKSGRCLVSSAKRDGLDFIAVTLNAPNDWNDHKILLDYAFGSYESNEILKKDQYLKTVNVINGNVERITVKSKDSFFIPVKKGASADITLKYNIPDSIYAPVGFGDVLGTIDIYLGEEKVGSIEGVSFGSASYVEPETLGRNIKKILLSWVLMNRTVC